MNVIELMKIHAANSGFAPAGVTYKPRDDMRIAIPLVEELIDAAESYLSARLNGRDCQANDDRLATALAAITE